MKLQQVTAALLVLAAMAAPLRAEIIVAEGEQFKPQDAKGWKLTAQDDSYASHTYGGMWVTNGAGLGAPAGSDGAVATYDISVAAPGAFRVWSKYQAPPYFNYLHRIDIVQNGATVFSQVYGKAGTDRLWSFSGQSDELWWPWGVDHDTAEAPRAVAQLVAGPAQVRLVTVPNAAPAGDRFIDFVVLTTNLADEYKGFKPYGVGTPFAEEAMAATNLYLRFQNSAPAAARITLSRAGHFQPQYGGASAEFPAAAVAPGQWSEWVNIGPFVRTMHNEGVTAKLAGATTIAVQVARDAAGNDKVGDFTVDNNSVFVVPKEITWQRDARVKPSRQWGEELITQAKAWPKSNGGHKPRELVYYGAFNGREPWIPQLKDALGYNTRLPDQYEHVQRDGIHWHIFDPAGIREYAKTIPDKSKFRILSFGDEIQLGTIDYNDAAMQTKFAAWLKARGVTAKELGSDPATTKPAMQGTGRLVWYSQLFNEEQRFAAFAESTRVAKEAIGPHVLTGANYSPHHLALFYGPIYQWVDLFKHNGMNMIWAEDYIFSVPEVPQIISFQFAEMRCGAKYNNQPIHFYVMPHAPGQTAGNLRRNMVYSIGAGAKHIDNFWVAPEENFTENYVAWGYTDSFRTLHDAIFDSGEVEKVAVSGKVRPGRVAVVLSKATDFNESRLMVDKTKDPFAGRSKNAPAQINQIICRKDQQMLYLALRQAQQGVDLITEDDIVELNALKDYDAVYFAGEWIDNRAIGKLDAWVKGGGVLYATAGIGHLNQYNEPEAGLAKILGLKSSTLTKNLYISRTLLELPLAQPIGTITLGGRRIEAIGMKQVLTPAGAQVLGKWEDGSAAVTINSYGKGKAYAVGTLAGNSYMKTALHVTPWARGGKKMVYHPTDFNAAATALVRLGVDAAKPKAEAVCSNNLVESTIIDSKDGTLVTLTNWTNGPANAVNVEVRLPWAPTKARQVGLQKSVPVTYANGIATFTVDIAEADYVLLTR